MTSIHQQYEYIEMAGERWHAAPLAYWVYANDFYTAAGLVPGASKPYQPARASNACQSLELALKAFLSLKGLSMAELAARPYRHDLQAIFNEAEKKGLADVLRVGDSDRNAVSRAHRYHFEKVLQYPSLHESIGGYKDEPDSDALLAFLARLLPALHSLCRAA